MKIHGRRWKGDHLADGARSDRDAGGRIAISFCGSRREFITNLAVVLGFKILYKITSSGKKAAAPLRADNKGPDDRSRGGRSLPRRGRLAVGLHLWSISMNVIRFYIVYMLPLESNSSMWRVNVSRPVDDRRALDRTLRRGSSGGQDRCLLFIS